MVNKDILLAEHNSLRREIESNSRITAQIFTFTITAVAFVVGYGLESKNWILFLGAFALLIPSLWFILSQFESIVLIATYIKTFIEPRVDEIDWENRLSRLRKFLHDPQKPLTSRVVPSSIFIAYTYIYGAIGIMCLLLSFMYFLKTSVNFVIYLTPCVVLIIIMAILLSKVKKCGEINFYHACCEAWKELTDKKK